MLYLGEAQLTLMMQRIQRNTLVISFRFLKIVMFWQGKKKEKSVVWELNGINIYSVFILLYLIAEGRVGLFDGTWEPNFASEVQANFA